MENTEKKKFTIWKDIVSMIEGFVLGAFSWLPFFNTKAFKTTLGREDQLYKDQKLGPALLSLLKENWPYIIAVILGAIFFFLTPVSYLFSMYKTAIFSMFICFAVGFSLLEIQRIRKNRNQKKHLLTTCISFGVGIILGIILHFIDLSSITEITSISSCFISLLLMMIATFIGTFSGIGIGTIFFFPSFYLLFASGITNLSYLNNISVFIPLLCFCLVGSAIGYFLSFILRRNKNISSSEQSGLALGLNLSGIIFIAMSFIDTKKAGLPFFNTTSKITEIAQLMVLLSVIFGSIFLSVVLSISSFEKLKKEKQNEEIDEDYVPKMPVEKVTETTIEETRALTQEKENENETR